MKERKDLSEMLLEFGTGIFRIGFSKQLRAVLSKAVAKAKGKAE